MLGQDPLQNFRQHVKLPASVMKSYCIRTPRDTHTRRASCAEVECRNHLKGWRTQADESTAEGRRIASQVRRLSRPIDAQLSPSVAARVRRYVESSSEGITWFSFPAGQECFAEHRVVLDRPELFIVRDGDIRGNPRGTSPYRHANAEDWIDDMANHQQKLSDAQQRG